MGSKTWQRLQQGKPECHFICVESVQCLACGKFKFCFLELRGIYLIRRTWAN
jgi:hypothetical protein